MKACINYIKLILFLGLKDLSLKPYSILITLFLPFLFILIGYLISIHYFEIFEEKDCIFLILRIGVITPLLFSEFFLIHEKSQGTFQLVRSLPVSDSSMYFAKALTGCFALFLSEIPGFTILYTLFSGVSKLFYPITILSVLAFSLCCIFFLSLWGGTRISFVISYGLTEIFIFLWRIFRRSFPATATQVSQDYLLYTLASVLLLMGTYIFFRLGVRHFTTRDTLELVAK